MERLFQCEQGGRDGGGAVGVWWGGGVSRDQK